MPTRKERVQSGIVGIMDVSTAIFQILMLVAAVALAVTKTPLSFWLPAFLALAATFIYSNLRRDGSHWPSTIFGILEILYVTALIVFLLTSGTHVRDLVGYVLELTVVHLMLYILAARHFLAASSRQKRDEKNSFSFEARPMKASKEE